MLLHFSLYLDLIHGFGYSVSMQVAWNGGNCCEGNCCRKMIYRKYHGTVTWIQMWNIRVVMYRRKSMNSNEGRCLYLLNWKKDHLFGQRCVDTQGEKVTYFLPLASTIRSWWGIVIIRMCLNQEFLTGIFGWFLHFEFIYYLIILLLIKHPLPFLAYHIIISNMKCLDLFLLVSFRTEEQVLCVWWWMNIYLEN